MKLHTILRRTAPLLILALVPGCATERLAQFGQFAGAGTAYVTTFHTFVADAGTAFINADSATLIAARNIAGDQVAKDPGTFRRQVAEQDRSLQQYLATLQKIDDHAALLGAWFAAITRLADGKASDATLASVNGLVDALAKINPDIETASFGGKTVKDFTGAAVPLVYAHFASKALNDELRRDAPVIDRALTLQEAAVSAIAEQMKQSLSASLQVREQTDILNPYVAAGGLPGSWPASREAFLRARVRLDSANAATAALGALHSAFRELVANPAAHPDFAHIWTMLGNMAGFASAAAANATH